MNTPSSASDKENKKQRSQDFDLNSEAIKILSLLYSINKTLKIYDIDNVLSVDLIKSLKQAIQDACQHRLRPVLMTALTTILGLVPLAIGIGEGGEAQAPMARVVIGGLLSSTLITLSFIPIMYSLFERWKSNEGM